MIKNVVNTYVKNKLTNKSLVIVDLNKINNQYDKWIRNMKNIKPHYAVKSNPDEIILKTLVDLDCNFDCASINEIKKIININANYNNKIIFANPIKSITDIIEAKNLNVNRMTLDCLQELNKINIYNKDAEILIRIVVDDSNSLCKFSKKFGCNIDEAKEILIDAKMNSQNICGVSFHVGSGCNSYESYVLALQEAKKIFDIGREIGHNMKMLDIGGGFLHYDTDNINFKKLSNIITATINNEFNDINDLEIIAEPGRFICAPAVTIYSSIIGKKIKYINGEKNIHYYIDNGVYGLFNNKIYDYQTINFSIVNDTETNKLTYNSTIFGPTCDSLDVIRENIMIKELEIGDKIYIENIGAYTIASATLFNGLNNFDKYYIKNDEII